MQSFDVRTMLNDQKRSLCGTNKYFIPEKTQKVEMETQLKKKTVSTWILDVGPDNKDFAPADKSNRLYTIVMSIIIISKIVRIPKTVRDSAKPIADYIYSQKTSLFFLKKLYTKNVPILFGLVLYLQ